MKRGRGRSVVVIFRVKIVYNYVDTLTIYNNYNKILANTFADFSAGG